MNKSTKDAGSSLKGTPQKPAMKNEKKKFSSAYCANKLQRKIKTWSTWLDLIRMILLLPPSTEKKINLEFSSPPASIPSTQSAT